MSLNYGIITVTKRSSRSGIAVPSGVTLSDWSTEMHAKPSLPLTEAQIGYFWEKVAVPSQPSCCWEWTGAQFEFGYGQFRLARKITRRAHRIAYELLVGPIPDRHYLHHLCKNTKCVNPDHLQPITVAEHNRLTYWSYDKVQACPHGHVLTPETYDAKYRRCRVCLRIRQRERKERQRTLTARCEKGAN